MTASNQRKPAQARTPLQLLGLLVLAALVYGGRQLLDDTGAASGENPGQAGATPPAAAPGTDPTAPQIAGGAGNARLLQAFRDRRSDLVLEIEGRVRKVLPDDNDGSRHQKFILELAGGHTVLVAHNIDLAPRVPDLQRGDVVEAKGEYEWSEQGGVLHWTHHDPRERHEGGWIRHDGATYQE